MTKVELIASVAAEAGMSKKDAEKAVNAALAAITEELKNGGKVSLVGFGTFEVRERPERQGRNPRTGETLTIPACKMVKFRPGKMLKDALDDALLMGVSERQVRDVFHALIDRIESDFHERDD